MLKTTSYRAILAVTALGLAACAGPKDSFEREAGGSLDEGGFGNPTMTNTLISNGTISVAESLGRRFAAEVNTMVNFEFNSSQLDANAKAALREQADWIRQFPEVRFRVYGHTDLVGSSGANQALGLRRAHAAVTYLVTQGVSRSRLEAVSSLGETRPLVTTESPERRNRRTVTEVSGFVDRNPIDLNGKYGRLVLREYVQTAKSDLSFEDATAYLAQPEASALNFIAVAVGTDDEGNLTVVGDVINRAKELGIKVILIAEDVSPIALHQLLKLGADDFVPYPLPEGALHDSIERINTPEPQPVADIAPATHAAPVATGQVGTHDGVILPIHGLAGGSGGSTFAVNLAWELATVDKKADVSVCLLDLDFQFGSASTYLDLPRRETVLEMLSDVDNMDDDAFKAALQTFNDKLQVLTAPADMIPLDMLSPEEIEKLVRTAQRNFDYVIVDMPTTLVQWTETVLGMAHVYFGMLELDLRSAQNALRMIRALKSEDLPYEKIR